MKWIISNHKEGLNSLQLNHYLKELKTLLYPNIKLVICPSNSQLKYFEPYNYSLGSQDIGNNLLIEDLKKLSIEYCIVGHSDFRKKYQETNEEINNKIKKLLENQIHPILCIGEEKKEEKKVKEILEKQLTECLQDIKSDKLMIAYEPVWAINSGEIPNKSDLIDRIHYIQTICKQVLGMIPPILYGGSVNEETVFVLESIQELNGYLIGNASLDIERLNKVIEVIK